MNPSNFHRLWIAAIAALMGVAYGVFSQGTSGGLHFDDLANLAGLGEVNSLASAMQFTLTGKAGPLGRPLSLASFATQSDAWPGHPERLIQANILIHLFNGILVAWFSWLLAGRAQLPNRPVFVLLVTAFWLLHPIQMSPVLFVVQRMTLLAGTFTLLGLIFYLLGRRPLCGFAQSVGWVSLAFAMTIPAALSKETGILLPGYLLILEYFLIGNRRPGTLTTVSGSVGQDRRYKLGKHVPWAWTMVFLIGLSLFLYRYWPSFAATFQAKGYSLAQHMATEARALGHYLMQILVPRAQEFSPFHDDFPISESWRDPMALAAAAGLLAMLGAAWWARHRLPLATVGILFFFLGHGPESTVIPLEPYFEHRNYLPLLGVAILLAALSQTVVAYRKLATFGLTALVAICTVVSFQYASLWGDRLMSAYLWQSEKPGSARATLHLADYLAEQQQWSEMSRILTKAWHRRPTDTNLGMSVLYGLCRNTGAMPDAATLGALKDTARIGVFTVKSTPTLDEVASLVMAGRCPALTMKYVEEMLDTLAGNPHYRLYPKTEADLMIIGAKITYSRGDKARSAELLERATAKDFRLDIMLRSAIIHAEAGNRAKANGLMQAARAAVPGNGWRRDPWLGKIDAAAAEISQISKNDL